MDIQQIMETIEFFIKIASIIAVVIFFGWIILFPPNGLDD